MIKEKNLIEGELSDILDSMSVDYPDVARLTLEVVACMQTCGVDKMEFNETVYEQIKDCVVRVECNQDEDKLIVEILKGE